MTAVNIDIAPELLNIFMAWRDVDPEVVREIHTDWDPRPETYEEDLERFARKHARLAAEEAHPEALEKIKAAMRWVLRDAPDFAERWYDWSLSGPEDPPEPIVRMWEWAWDEVFGDEPWDIEGEEFELYSDLNEPNYSAARNWDRRPPPKPEPAVWPPPPIHGPPDPLALGLKPSPAVSPEPAASSTSSGSRKRRWWPR
jgi:hypothetical protein